MRWPWQWGWDLPKMEDPMDERMRGARDAVRRAFLEVDPAGIGGNTRARSVVQNQRGRMRRMSSMPPEL